LSGLGTEEEEYSPKWVLLALVVVALLVLAGVAAFLAVPLQQSNGGGGNNTAASGSVVMPSGVGSNIKQNFSPDVITVIIGKNSTVTWVNQDGTTHTVTATDNSFNSGDIKAGASWSYQFSTAGTYTYYCLYHSAWMKGTVIVKSG